MPKTRPIKPLTPTAKDEPRRPDLTVTEALKFIHAKKKS